VNFKNRNLSIFVLRLKTMQEQCEKSAHELLKQKAMVVDIDSDLGKKLSVSRNKWPWNDLQPILSSSVKYAFQDLCLSQASTTKSA